MDARLLGATFAVVASLVCVFPCVAQVASDSQPCQMAVATAVVEVAEDGGEKVFIVKSGSGASPGVAVKRCDKAVVIGAGAGHNRGWLGVQLAEVSPALEAQLPADQGGVVVHNVVKGSPAEDAGLKKYDVITSMNGARIENGVAGLAKAIGALEPGAEVSLAVLREGKELTLQATLASRPDRNEFHWLHEYMPEAVEREIIRRHGKIISKDEDGNWRVEDLGDLAEMENLPDEIRELLPGAGEIITTIMVDDDQESVNVMVMQDGETIAIEQEDGGEIVVKRTDKDGNETEATYADADALKEADPEAYEVYDGIATGARLNIFLGDDEDDVLHRYGHGYDLHNRSMEEARKHFEGAHKQLEDARGQLHDARKLWKLHLSGIPKLPSFFSNGNDLTMFGSDMAIAGEATRSFRVNPDGEIEVIIRKGENEITKVFRDEADLEQRDPALHEQYADVLSDE